jgi:hypothetical protein
MVRKSGKCQAVCAGTAGGCAAQELLAIGLGQYEIRYWHSWYRHMTLALMAHAWLTLLRHEEAQKKFPSTSLLAAAESR